MLKSEPIDRNYFLNHLRNILLMEFGDLSVNYQKKGDEIDLMVLEREEAMLRKLQGRKSFYLKKIKDAMRRIQEGTYGKCEECGEDIGKVRLMARPTACMCIKCKDQEEREEGQLLYHKRSHTLGKRLDTVEKTRIKLGETQEINDPKNLLNNL